MVLVSLSKKPQGSPSMRAQWEESCVWTKKQSSLITELVFNVSAWRIMSNAFLVFVSHPVYGLKYCIYQKNSNRDGQLSSPDSTVIWNPRQDAISIGNYAGRIQTVLHPTHYSLLILWETERVCGSLALSGQSVDLETLPRAQQAREEKAILQFNSEVQFFSQHLKAKDRKGNDFRQDWTSKETETNSKSSAVL